MLTPVPLLIIPFALYNIVAFLTPGLEWNAILWQVRLPSGALWDISTAKAFIAFSLLFLLFEILKSARVHARSFMDHGLSALIMLISLAEFLLVPQAGTSTFAILICIMFLDVVIGITAAIRAPRRARAAKNPPVASSPAPRPAPAPAPAPVVTPAPAQATAPATQAPPVSATAAVAKPAENAPPVTPPIQPVTPPPAEKTDKAQPATAPESDKAASPTATGSAPPVAAPEAPEAKAKEAEAPAPEAAEKK